MASSVTIAPTTVEPIRRAFPAEKAKAWHYKIHPYCTKQPSNVVGEYIRHFCSEGGLVVDPFCGSSVTAIEARCREPSRKQRTLFEVRMSILYNYEVESILIARRGVK